jgi:hypothetical protein
VTGRAVSLQIAHQRIDDQVESAEMRQHAESRAQTAGVVGYVSKTTNIVKALKAISATSTGIAKRVTFFAAAALRLSLFSDGASL